MIYILSRYSYISLPEKTSLLSGCIPMSNPIEVPEEAADHVQEVEATHSHLPSYLALPPGAERNNNKISKYFAILHIWRFYKLEMDFLNITFLKHSFSSLDQL